MVLNELFLLVVREPKISRQTMLKQGQHALSYHVRNIAECALDFSGKLGEDCSFPAEEALSDLLREAARVPAVAVIGDSCSGKSSVLDLMVDPKVNTFGRMARNVPVLHWRFDADAPGKPVPGASVAYYPLPLLRDVEFIDTSIQDFSRDGDLLRVALQRADIIIMVISAMMPYSRQAWDFISQLPPEYFTRMIIAVTHPDECSFDQIQSVKDIIREDCRRYLNTEPPLFPVCGGGSQRGYGADALSRRVNHILSFRLTSLGMNAKVIAAAATLLEEQKKVLRNQDRLLRMDSSFMEKIEEQIDFFSDLTARHLPNRLEAMSSLVQGFVPRLARKTARQLGHVLSINRIRCLGHMAGGIDNWFYKQVSHSIEERQEYYNREFLSKCAEHWNSIRPDALARMECDIGEFPVERLRQSLDNYRRRLGRAVYKPLNEFGLKSCLAKFYAAQKKWMRGQLIFVFLLIASGGILGALGESSAGFVLVGCAALLWVLASLVLIFVKIRLIHQLEESAVDLHLAIASGLREPLFLATMGCLVDYRKLYTDIRGQVAVSAEQITPLISEHNQLYYKLAAMRQPR